MSGRKREMVMIKFQSSANSSCYINPELVAGIYPTGNDCTRICHISGKYTEVLEKVDDVAKKLAYYIPLDRNL